MTQREISRSGKGGMSSHLTAILKLFVFEVTACVHVLEGKQIFITSSPLESQQHSSLYKAIHLYSACCFLLLSSALVSPAGLPAL